VGLAFEGDAKTFHVNHRSFVFESRTVGAG
jgi:hypothetical protein